MSIIHPIFKNISYYQLDDNQEIFDYYVSLLIGFYYPKDIACMIAEFLIHPYKIGNILDCMDNYGMWYKSTILHVYSEGIFIHYQGWPSKLDEWISTDEFSRVDPFLTHSHGIPRVCKKFFCACEGQKNEIITGIIESGSYDIELILKYYIKISTNGNKIIKFIKNPGPFVDDNEQTKIVGRQPKNIFLMP